MTETMHENMEDLVPPAAEPAAVDEGKVRRQSMMDGAWKGIKRGLMWGGIAGLGMTTLGTVLAYSVGGAALKTGAGLAANAPAWALAISKIPYVGVPIALALTGAGIAAGAGAISSFSMSGLALGAMTTFGSIALPVIGIGLAAGAAIGATWGAISGYMESDSKIEQEHRKSAQVAAQLNFERQRVLKEMLQERDLERQFDQQSKQLYTGNGPEIGNFSSPNTPTQGIADKGQDPNQRGWS